MGRGAYQLDDGTGQLWIVSDGELPRNGARVLVKGKVRDGFKLGGLADLPEDAGSSVVLVESSHQETDKP